ncbi:MAG: TolC family protein [Leptolyngbyaceae cyanobacterium MAG.088]|nr:TolC family protein [Leptolyngbyaceae cyanobacterium MAG.088]
MLLHNRLSPWIISNVLLAAAVLPGLAQPGLPDLPPAADPPSTSPGFSIPDTSITEDLSPNNERSDSEADNADNITPSASTVSLTATDVVTLLLENNLDLRNEVLERIAQQQDLEEVERIFLPDFIPTLRLGLSDREDAVAEITREALLQAEFLTPLGTDIAVAVDIEDRELDLSLNQPLLRGSGRAVNTSQIEIARLQEDNNRLTLRQRLILDITSGILTYHGLIRAQAALQIQQLSLATQQERRRSVAALVEAGRRAQFELVEIDANLAATKTNVLEAENALEQAQSNLLNLLDVSDTLEITIPDSSLANLNTIDRAFVMPSLEQLVAVAYIHRPDYQQLQSDLKIVKLEELVAVDNRRWNLDLRANASTGDLSEASTELVLTHLLDDESTKTALERNRVRQQQLNNDFERLNSDIRLEVEDQLRNVESARNRIEATRRARELAEKRLENVLALARAGRNRDSFEVLELQNAVVTAQNSEVNAAIDLADAIATLHQALGTTLVEWAEQVDASQLLVVPESLDAISND